VAALALAH